MAGEPRLEEQALSQVVQMGIESQLDAVESLDVDVRSDLVNMVQGQADSVSVKGKGLVAQKELRVQEMELRTNRLAINLLSALFGEIELNQPVDGTVRVVLTEADINRALNSEYILSNLPPLELNVDGQVVAVELRSPLSVHLPGEGRMGLSGNLHLPKTEKHKDIGFTATLLPRTNEQPILLEEFRCTPGTGVSIDFLIALMQKLKELTNLPYIELSGMALRIKELDPQVGSLTLVAEAHVYQVSS